MPNNKHKQNVKLNVAKTVKTFHIHLNVQFCHCYGHCWNVLATTLEISSLWTENWYVGEENVFKLKCSDVSILVHLTHSQEDIIIWTVIWLSLCGALSRPFCEEGCTQLPAAEGSQLCSTQGAASATENSLTQGYTSWRGWSIPQLRSGFVWACKG